MSTSAHALPTSFGVTEHIEREYLEATFDKGLQKIKKLSNQIRSLGELGPVEDLSIYALHYLVKGAKIPILNMDRKTSLSYLEFLSDSNPKYFRSQGGSILTLYMHLLKLGAYKFLFEKQSEAEISDSVQPVKHANFRKYLRMQFDYARIPTNSPELAKEAGKLQFVRTFRPSSATDKTILDVTPLLVESPDVAVSPQDLRERISKVKAAIREMPEFHKNLTIVAFVKLEDGQQVCISFNDNKLKSTDSREEIDALIKSQDEMIKENKAHSGYFPDIIDIRRSILRMGVRCDDILGIYPFKPEKIDSASSSSKPTQIDTLSSTSSILPTASGRDVRAKMQEIHEKMAEQNEKDPKNLAKSFYLNLFSRFIESLQNKIPDSIENDLTSSLVMSSLTEIEELVNGVSKYSAQSDHLELLNDIDLITEEFVYLLAILKPFDQTLEETLKQTGVKFGTEHAQKSSYAFTSGMNGFSHVLSALAKQSKGSQEKLKIACTTTTYFEFRLEVLPHLTKAFDPASNPVDPFKPITEDCDVFFMDLYPNEVTLPSVERVDANRIVTELLTLRKGKPLTVVIDTSTSLFSSQDIQNLVTRFGKEIDNGQLNLVIINSLAKFSMCGLDKFTGGVVQTYNNSNDFKAFNQLMVARQSQERLSPEAERFFQLFFSYAPDLVEDYLQKINQNTDRLYQALAPDLQTGKTAMALAGKHSDQIPMLSFQFDTAVDQLIHTQKLSLEDRDQAKANMAILLQYYIYAQARAAGLPIDTRLSFGFAHSNLNDCWIALRMTVGLENPEILAQYRELFLKANAEFEEMLQDPTLLELVKAPDQFFYEKFKNIKDRQTILQVTTHHGHGLKPFLETVKSTLLPPSEVALEAIDEEPATIQEPTVGERVSSFLKSYALPVLALGAVVGFGIWKFSRK